MQNSCGPTSGTDTSRFVLVLGGARSGKSRYAQQLAAASALPVLFVATATPGDEEMRRRIENHKRSRPAHWHTHETPLHLGTRIRENLGENRLVIIDCITMLVSNVFGQCGAGADVATIEAMLNAEIAEVLDCIKQTDARYLVVSNEVGLGIVPADPATRLYRDLLGLANQTLAREADEVILMVAGLAMRVKG